MARSTTAAAAVATEQTDLLPVSIPAGARQPKQRLITRSQIHPDPEQPREQADAELRNSIATQGLLEPIIVRPHPSIMMEWMIVNGERRWRGCEGVLEDIPCIIRTDLEDEVARLAVQMVANTGKPMTPIEEAKAFHRMLQASGESVADLADRLGRPKSTVAERLALLELGPWVPMIAAGELPMSHAVKVLLPLRRVPDTFHERAIEAIKADYRWQKKGEGRGISLGDFQRLVERYYRAAMYPLAKTKGYGKQPEFNTAKHDQECDCGTVKFDLGNGSPRTCCCNPEWWRPLHRKALAEKKKASPASAKKESGPKFYLPAGTPVVKSDWGRAPKGVIQLTDAQGRWATAQDQRADEGPFDPVDLKIDDAKLVQWSSGNYGVSYPIVGTKDTAAVAAARKLWRERFELAAQKVEEQLQAALEQHADTYRVEGPGLVHLVETLNGMPTATIDIADALGIDVAPAIRKMQHWDQGKAVVKWARALPPDDLARLFTGLATVNAVDKLTLTSEAIEDLQRKTADAIAKRAVPWRTKSKAEKPKAKASARRAPNVAFMQPMFPSAALAAVLGPSSKKGITRVEVTKKLWAYIKRQKLQDQKNRRMINADEKLLPVFGHQKSVSLFEMTKLVNKQLAATAEAAARIVTGAKKAAKKAKAPATPAEDLDELNDHAANAAGDLDGEDDEAWTSGSAADEDDEDLWDTPVEGELEEAEV